MLHTSCEFICAFPAAPPYHESNPDGRLQIEHHALIDGGIDPLS